MQNPLVGILPADQADLILIMLLSIPLSYLLSLVYNRYIFLALTMALTIGIQSILFPNERWILWGQQQLVYLLVVFSPRKYVGRIVIIECFIALSMLHVWRLYTAYGENLFDITGIFMMQLFNYIGLGYNYQNGGSPRQSLTADQIERMVVQKPNYLTYLGYVNFLPACVVGPVYEYADFMQYLDRKGDYTSIPSTIPAVIRESGVFLFALALYGATSIFPLSRLTDDIFWSYSLPYRLFYCVMSITHIELKYVVAWSLGMISMRASGFTYNPSKNVKHPDGTILKYDFGRVEVNNMTKFYLDPSMKVKVDHWNISVQWALRKYIYQNIYNPKDYPEERKRKKKQAQAQIYTILVSAWWHGLYPGYFVSFFHWIIYIQIAQQMFRLKKAEQSIVHRLNKMSPRLYNLLENAGSTFAMTYFGVGFHLMTWSRIHVYLQATYYLPYILLYLGFFLIVKVKILRIFNRKARVQMSQKKIEEKTTPEAVGGEKKHD